MPVHFSREHFEFLVEWFEDRDNYKRYFGSGTGKTRVGGKFQNKTAVSAELAEAMFRKRSIVKKIKLDEPKMKQRYQ